MKSKSKKFPSKKIDLEKYLSEILSGNISYLSRAITLVESKNSSDQIEALKLIQACMPYTQKSIRIGITGPPGVGKSTFIEAFGTYLTSLGKKIAVLAIDPSSSLNKGSILGDKTRMEELSRDKNAFIRPSAAGSTLGGVARKTKEAIGLCEAAGYEIILIETVGVGQSETMVYNMTDFFLLLHLAGTGDELQGIKRGIVELADGIAINKAEVDNLNLTKLAQKELQSALHFYPPKENSWIPKVLTCSALNRNGIEEIWSMVTDFVELTRKNGFFDKKRIDQESLWFRETLQSLLFDDFFHSEKIKTTSKILEKEIRSGKTSPFEAAHQLIEIYKKEKEEN